MNKNITAIILIILAVGIYFTFTSSRMDELKAIQAVNNQYQEAIKNSETLINERDRVNKEYSAISIEDKERLNRLLPNTVDNIRLIIDVKDNIAAKRGLTLKNIKTSSPEATQAIDAGASRAGDTSSPKKYGTVNLSFSVTTSYENFIGFMKDLESSLRIMDISKLTVSAVKSGAYEFSVEIKTYWLKE